MKRRSKLPHWPPRLPMISAFLQWRSISKVVIALVTTAVLTALIFVHLDYYQVDSRLEQFRAGQPATHDVIARSTVKWIDADETKRKQDEAASQASVAYAIDPKASTTAQAALNALTAWVRNGGGAVPRGGEKIQQEVLRYLRSADAATYSRLHREAQAILDDVTRTRAGQNITGNIVKSKIDELVKARETDPQCQRALAQLTTAALQPTWVIDEKSTEKLQRDARAAVPQVIRTYHTGEVILRQGEIVTEDELTQLRGQQLLTPAPLTPLLPLAAIMLFAVLSLGVYLRTFVRDVYDQPRKLTLLAGLISIALLVSTWLLGDSKEYLISLIVVPATVMAIAGLLGYPTAIVSTLLLSISIGLTADHQFNVILLSLGSSVAGMMAVSSIWPASRAIPAVIALAVVNLILLVGIGSLSANNGVVLSWAEFGKLALFAGLGSLGATMFAVGAIYLLARPFGITTFYRLMELSNPNEPLLRRMMLEAPGSYHSSVMVANIAEAAADAVGANALLTRVAALYHDVGKLKRPGFFVENQAPLGIENMHQRLSPKLSYLILTSHVKDGAETAREYKLPEQVQQIIREHHGTTLAAYFYHRAVSEAGEGEVPEHEFRYPGPKPSTREAAIVMLADSVQASVKSLKEPTPSRIENMVDDIINNRLSDGQLEDCDITLRDLRRISQVLIRILTGLYTYTRIEYPEMKNGEGSRHRANTHTTSAPPASEPAAAPPRG